MNEYSMGLDEEIEQENAEKESNVTSIEEVKRKRKPFHYWTVSGIDHKMKLSTSMITKLENKYHTNIMTLIVTNDIPPLSVMLTVAQAAIAPWEHGTSIEKTTRLYDEWILEGGNQSEFLTKVILPTLAVSGFFTENQARAISKTIAEEETLS